MRSRSKHQLSLPPVEVRTSERQKPAFRRSEQSAKAASLFNEALEVAKLDSKDVARLLDVSVSLVDKWRDADEPASPSFVQMLCLPLAFHLALHRVMNDHFGFGRAALKRLLETVGDLAAVSGDGL